MSFVIDQVRRIDSQFDGITPSLPPSTSEPSSTLARTTRLESLIKSLSLGPSRSLLPAHRIRSILSDAQVSQTCHTCKVYNVSYDVHTETAKQPEPSYEHELEWLLLSKATTQLYGLVLHTMIEQTIPLDDDIWYWDDIRSSYRYAGLYSIQTSPLRFWAWSKDVWHDLRRRGGRLEDGWTKFYELARDVVRQRSLADIQRRVVSPLALVREEALRKRKGLEKIKLLNANALGYLLGEGLSNESAHEEHAIGAAENADDETRTKNRHKWKATVVKSITLMEAVFREVNNPDTKLDSFDDAVTNLVVEDPWWKPYASTGSEAMTLKPEVVAARLENVISKCLPNYTTRTTTLVRKEYGRPSRIVRYWPAVTVALISSSTILRVAVNRKEDIITWIRELGATVIDFWSNWVVEPLKKVIGTIRHDESAEVSILSKRSLEGDRASLERMVVDFAIQHPPEGRNLTEVDIADIRSKVREGDLTPVLVAYEREMQAPLKNAVTGNLIQALLVQIQKTKVDIEVAMSGIDSILKSQELLFGFIGLTPGVLVCIGVYRSIKNTFGSRRGLKRHEKQGQLIRSLRNIDRILAAASVNKYEEISYKDHGLLLCETHILRLSARQTLPPRVFRDFVVELRELEDVRAGYERMNRTLERMWRAYARV
ncbi:hypothetical protein W97_03910 [Coniosporium apollinis CBS 100218]|uniref:ATP synthase regulation protein NCA2 n=1 Tax=Coniosporium apollinis (strain CBS 100218) TaxID=1168221 RepID=R7YRY1_CONA1|nr:uncharacterized protein W97_03910 [Coniosporium apollinis CBS 100218]EON64677.1 hypothetical protein W97_03910 [Coniosporium apollinis CBS 100218]